MEIENIENIEKISTMEEDGKDQCIIKYDKDIMWMCMYLTDSLCLNKKYKKIIKENDIDTNIINEMFYDLYSSPDKIKKIVNIFDKDEEWSITLQKTRNLIDLNYYNKKYRCDFRKPIELFLMCQFIVKHGTDHYFEIKIQ
jgi:hypothetical protein